MGIPSVEGFLHLHICLKDGYNTEDELKAWIHAADFVNKMQALGWNTHDCALLSGSPVTVILSVENVASEATKRKKTR